MKSTTRVWRKRKSERGQAIVEMALLAPFLILMALTAVDLGRGVSQYIEVVNAASSAAQYGSASQSHAADPTTIRKVACDDLDHLTCSHIDVASVPDDGRGESMGLVQVSVSVPFHTLTPIIGDFLSVNLSSTSVMRVDPSGGR